MELLEPLARAILRRLYQRCDALLVPSESTAAVLHAQRMNKQIAIWARGVDREQFNPGRRDMDWRRGLGIADDEMVVAFLGRIVMEKGLDVFADAIDALDSRGVRAPRAGDRRGAGARLVRGAAARSAVFVGHQEGADLARALASTDVFLNPSITETFGNVTLEAMACKLPVVAAVATGATSLVRDGKTGLLVEPGDAEAYADALAGLCAQAGDADQARRGGPGVRQDDGLGPDQLGGPRRLRPGDRAPPPLRALTGDKRHYSASSGSSSLTS